MKKWKHVLMIIATLLLIVVASSFFVLQPKVRIICELKSITIEEYNMLNNSYKEQYSSSDFKNLIIKVEGKNLRELNQRIINVPSVDELREAIQNYSDSSYMGVKGKTQNNENEDFFIYDYSIMLNMKQLTYEELIVILRDYNIEIKIKNEMGFKHNINYNIGEHIEK